MVIAWRWLVSLFACCREIRVVDRCYKESRTRGIPLCTVQKCIAQRATHRPIPLGCMAKAIIEHTHTRAREFCEKRIFLHQRLLKNFPRLER